MRNSQPVLHLHDEAESALIGALVTEPSTFDEVSESLRPLHFSIHGNQRVACAVWDLQSSKRPVDRVTVMGWFLERGELTADVQRAIDAATKKPAPASSAKYYAEQLREAWASMRLAEIGEDLANAHGTVAERIDLATKSLQRLDLGRTGRARPFSELFAESMERWGRERASPEGRDQLIPTGLPRLDRFIGGLVPGELAVFAARAGTGKSAVAITVASNIAATGVPVGVFWLEDRAHDFVRRAVARRLRIRAMALRHGSQIVDQDWESLLSEKDAISKLPIWVDDTHALTSTEIATRMRRMHREHGVRVFFADHLGEMRVEREERWGDRHDLALGRAARDFRDAAGDLNAVPVLCVQLNRGAEKRAEWEPKMSDLADSGHIEQVARIVAMCHRPDANSFHLKLVKNTNGPKDAVAECRWLEDYMAVENQ